MYTDKDFKSKKALKEAVAAFNAGTGPAVTFYQPGGIFPTGNPTRFCVEGPHGFHKFYAECTARDGAIIAVK